MKQKLLPMMAVAVLLLATASIVRTQPQLKTNPPPLAPPRSGFEERVAAVGLVEPRSENISIASHLPGVVERVFVAAGQEAKAGDPLIKLDTRALEAARAERAAAIAAREAAVAAAGARAAKARAALEEARRNLKFAESISDRRSISAEELARRASAVEIADAEAKTADAEVQSATAAVQAAQAALETVRTDLERSIVKAPMDGRVLQARIRPGEFAPAGPSAEPWMVLGDVSTLHLRVDIDEYEAWRVRAGSRAVAQPRGNARLEVEAEFVRFEPLVVPKVSLTGASTERVDTRVLQAIYRLRTPDFPLYVGQQMDVFIDAGGLKTAMIER